MRHDDGLWLVLGMALSGALVWGIAPGPRVARSAPGRTKARPSPLPPDLFGPNAGKVYKSTLKRVKPLTTAQRKKHAAGANRFAWALYDRLRRKKGNHFFSPYSVATALALVRAGAAGRTRKELARVMQIRLTEGQVHRGFNGQLATLNGSGVVRAANSLWGRTGVRFLPAFLKLTRRYYGATLSTVDFGGDPTGAAQRINRWCARRTANRIKQVVSARQFSADTRLVLVNAIYFKADWKNTFDKKDTSPRPFFLDRWRRRHVKAATMYRMMSLRYYRRGRLALGVLPYLNTKFSMVVLTYRGRLSVLEGRLRKRGALAKLLRKAKPKVVEVYLPKFQLSATYGLQRPLRKMGLRRLLSPRADLSATAVGRKLFVSRVRHRAWVQVDEEGTTAAAVTAISEDENGDDTHPVLRADMPFLFLLRHNPTGLILFVGRVANPTPGARVIRRRPRSAR